MQDVTASLEQYKALGFDTLPLEPGTKRAWLKGWPRLPPEVMWQEAPENANIGIRAGGPARLAIIDIDDKEKPGTLATMQRWLGGLGYPSGAYPLVRTASGMGGHIYVTFAGGLSGSCRHLEKSLGAGEFRHGSGAYVVAPPSRVGSAHYSLLAGDFRNLPVLSLADVSQILRPQEVASAETERAPNKVNFGSRLPLALLNGEGAGRYSCRSKAEQAIITGLVNQGRNFDNILGLFLKYPCAGKFKEKYHANPEQAVSWLKGNYANAVEWAATHESPTRQSIQAAIEWAQSRPWKGRTGLNDCLVYLAHAQIAYDAGKLEYAASVRTLAGMTGLSPDAAMNATHRLLKAKYIKLVTEWTGDCANIYQLKCQTLTYPPPPCEEVSEFGTGERESEEDE